jgi:cation diffusion facilitator family transporter
MTDLRGAAGLEGHSHVFLGSGHEENERRTWGVIILCGVMMLVEIIGGSLFGSLALIADGLHMSTHAGAMLIAALAYTYARRHASDSRFVFGTGKLGDLAGFSSAIVLAMIALLIGYEAVSRFLAPVPIHFAEAIPIAVVGLIVNIVSARLLSGGEHHSHTHGHGHGNHTHDETRRIATAAGAVELSIFEQGVPPRFRLKFDNPKAIGETWISSLHTIRPNGKRHAFNLANRGNYWESLEEIPEPHEFRVLLEFGDEIHEMSFVEHQHEHAGEDASASSAHRDNSIRSAYIHVLADTVVSVLAITGLILARSFGWLWMDPLAGIVGAFVIANWSYGLIRDTGGILLDVNPDPRITAKVRELIESEGDRLIDLHLWRLGPGHLGAVISVATKESRDCRYYRARLSQFSTLSHVTVEVMPAGA